MRRPPRSTRTHTLSLHDALPSSAPGIAPSAVHLSAGLETDSMDVTGALSADAITEADLAVGRYDGAQVELFMTDRSEEHTSELQSLMRISYAVFCLKKKINSQKHTSNEEHQ